MVTGAIPIVSTVIDCLKRTVYGEAAGYSERTIYFHVSQSTSRQLGAKLQPSSCFPELRAKLARSSYKHDDGITSRQVGAKLNEEI